MKKLMTLMLLLMTLSLSAQFVNGNFELDLECPDDCELINSQMNCIPFWDATSANEIKYVQRTSCDEDVVCNGDRSILLETSNDEVMGISTINPVEVRDIIGIPEVIRFKTHVLSGSGPSTTIIVDGINGTNTVELGHDLPDQTEVCEEIIMLLYDNDFPVHSFESLEFSARSNSGSTFGTHAAVIDDLELCGPLFTIEDNCTELIINFVDCDLASFIHTARIFGPGCEPIDVPSENFGEPVICTIPEPGNYIIEVGLSYNFNPDFLADLFTVNYEVTCCDEPIPNYTFVDDEGNEKDEFCFGEDVFIDTEGTANQDRWFLSIWKYNIGGLAAGEDNLEYCRILPDEPQPTWAQGQIPPSIHLNPLWADCFGTQGFEPGFEYRVQLAVTSNCFGGWHVKEDEVFTVVCCDEFAADARFTPNDTDFEEEHYTIEAVLYDQYQNLNAEHEWYIYTVNDDGTFNQITIIYDPELLFEPAIYGVEYFIFHRVITDCEEVCYETCHRNGGGPNEQEEREERLPECPGAEVNCDLIDDIFPPCSELVAPTNLQVVNGMLTWTPVPGAESYTVTGQIGGIMTCECGNNFPISFTLGDTETNSIPIPDNLLERCFQWNVTANCGDGVTSALSEPACHYPAMLKENEKETENDTERPFRRNNLDASISVNPNPAKDYFEVYNNSSNEVLLELYNINGQLINTVKNVEANSQTTIDTRQLVPGLYFLNIKNQNDNSFISSQKIIIQK